MTNYNERLDDLLTELRSGTINFDDEAKQAILRWVADEIVPKHKHNNWCFIHCQFGDKSANEFIEEKREVLAKHGYKGGE